MAMVVTDDPYYRRTVITHDAVTAIDTGDPAGAMIILPKFGTSIVKLRIYKEDGTATIVMKEYAGKLSEKLSDEIWCVASEPIEFDSADGIAQTGKFVTDASIIAIYVTVFTGSDPLTIEACLGATGVANN